MRWVWPLLLLGLAAPAVAEPALSESIRFYRVSALTADGLRKEMAQNGPEGYWGYGRWTLRWSANCKVRLKTTIDLPRHSRPTALPPDLRRAWDAMVTALLAHERQHTTHGLQAALEIERSKCRNPHDIVDRWSAEDKRLDRRTDHGLKDGVQLPRH